MITYRTSARLGLSSAFALAVVLAASPSGPTFAGCVWTWEPDHDPPGWRVDCSFREEIFIEAEGSGGGGAGGAGCSNCVAMTAEQCTGIKWDIIDRSTHLIDSSIPEVVAYIAQAKINISEVRDLVSSVREEGNAFETFTLGSVGSVPGELGNGGKYYYLLNTAQGPYLANSGETNSSNQIRVMIGGANSIYNYYTQRVEPFLVAVDDYLIGASYALDSADDTLSGVSANVYDIRATADAMNCEACASSGSGDSGGGSGTPGDGGCPCAEYIQAVQSAVVENGETLSSLLSSVNTSKDTLAAVLAKLAEIKTVLDNIKDDVYKIRRTTDLMDDFFMEDTELNFAKLIEHTLTLSNVVVKFPSIPQYILHSDYSNATHFVDNDEQHLNWSQVGRMISTPTDGMPIDFGEYSKLNWFQRVEYLLGSLAQIFTPTNAAPPDDFSDGEKAQIASSQSGISGVSYDEPKGIVQSLLSKVESSKSRLNPFQNFLYGVQKPSTVTVIPDVSLDGWFDGFKLPSMVQTSGAITIDVSHSGDHGSGVSISTIADLAHNISTFIWLLMLFVINITFFVFFVRSLVRLNKWYWRMVNAWSPTLVHFN